MCIWKKVQTKSRIGSTAAVMKLWKAALESSDEFGRNDFNFCPAQNQGPKSKMYAKTVGELSRSKKFIKQFSAVSCSCSLPPPCRVRNEVDSNVYALQLLKGQRESFKRLTQNPAKFLCAHKTKIYRYIYHIAERSLSSSVIHRE